MNPRAAGDPAEIRTIQRLAEMTGQSVEEVAKWHMEGKPPSDAKVYADAYNNYMRNSLSPNQAQADAYARAAVSAVQQFKMSQKRGPGQGGSNVETKVIGGKTYFKRNGQWYEQ